MRRVELSTTDVTLDFSTAGLSAVSTKRLLGGPHLLLSNAITLVQFEDPMQIMICECCGCTQCASGGWVSARRVGNSVALIPAFEKMSEGAFQLTEYAPPGWAELGIPLLTENQFLQLGLWIEALPTIDEIPVISSREAVLSLQWDSVGSILGRHPATPKIARDLLLAVSEGEPSAQADQVEVLLADLTSHNRPMAVTSEPSTEVTFYLDLPKIPEWTPVAQFSDGRIGLSLSDGLAAVPAD